MQRCSLFAAALGLLSACGGATRDDPGNNSNGDIVAGTGGSAHGTADAASVGQAGTTSTGGSSLVGAGDYLVTDAPGIYPQNPDALPNQPGDVGPDGGCGPNKYWEYRGPGCEVKPVCVNVTDTVDAVFLSYCSCRGVTIHSAREPWERTGACPEAGTDAQPYDVVVGEGGWQWNVNCERSIDSLCAAGTSAIPCVQPWSEASKPSSWCDRAGATDVYLYGYCNGYWVVAVYGADPIHPGGAVDYFYDIQTGDLVHVDSNAIPSLTKCVAGVSGSRFDLAGCNYGSFSCQ